LPKIAPSNRQAEYRPARDQHGQGYRHPLLPFLPVIGERPDRVKAGEGIRTGKSLRGASIANIEALSEHTGKFIEAYNLGAKPFIWKKREIKGAQLANHVRNFCN
jgi:hypothetical protein